MRIACFGDSLTEGTPGVGYFKLLEADFPEDEFYNFGKVGDTVISLYERLQQMTLGKYDISVLWVGGNDVLSDILFKSSITGKEPEQKPSSTVDEFTACYDKILKLLLSCSRHIITVPPLTIGEDFDSEWNKKLDPLASAVKTLCASHPNITFIDLRAKFKETLEGFKSSDFYLKSGIGLLMDTAKLRTPEMVDKKSAERGLMLTLDGVHLNSKGAQLVKEIIKESICQLNLTNN